MPPFYPAYRQGYCQSIMYWPIITWLLDITANSLIRDRKLLAELLWSHAAGIWRRGRHHATHFIDRKREVEHKHKQKDLDATSKKIIKMTETLSPTICEMAESSIPVEVLPDLIRSVTGTQTSQNNQLADFSLEALKALSSVPKK